MKTTKTKLIWTDDINQQFGTEEEIRKEYQDCNELTDEEMDEVSEGTVEEWANELTSSYFDDLIDEVRHFDKNHNSFLVIGNLGLWNGRQEGGKVVHGLDNAIRMTMEDYNEIYEERGCLKVKAIHHDGTNYYSIYKLSEKGSEFFHNKGPYLDRKELCETLSKPHYRRNVNFCKNVYGC